MALLGSSELTIFGRSWQWARPQTLALKITQQGGSVVWEHLARRYQAIRLSSM